MSKELAMKWVEALRSGKYEQGKGYLKNPYNKYCCLGVLCEVEVIKDYTTLTSKQDDPNTFYPGIALRTKNGTYAGGADNLVDSNDSGLSFEEIADIVERHWEEL